MLRMGIFAAGRNVADRGSIISSRSDILLIILILSDTVLTRTLLSHVRADWSFLDLKQDRPANRKSQSFIDEYSVYPLSFWLRLLANTRALSL